MILDIVFIFSAFDTSFPVLTAKWTIFDSKLASDCKWMSNRTCLCLPHGPYRRSDPRLVH